MPADRAGPQSDLEQIYYYHDAMSEGTGQRKRTQSGEELANISPKMCFTTTTVSDTVSNYRITNASDTYRIQPPDFTDEQSTAAFGM